MIWTVILSITRCNGEYERRIDGEISWACFRTEFSLVMWCLVVVLAAFLIICIIGNGSASHLGVGGVSTWLRRAEDPGHCPQWYGPDHLVSILKKHQRGPITLVSLYDVPWGKLVFSFVFDIQLSSGFPQITSCVAVRRPSDHHSTTFNYMVTHKISCWQILSPLPQFRLIAAKNSTNDPQTIVTTLWGTSI